MESTRHASVIRLRPEREAAYRHLHAALWPAIRERLAASHITNYSIFLRDGLLFSYLEYAGDDFAADMAALAADQQMQRWLEVTMPCQEPLQTARQGEWWSTMDEVFHLD